MDSDVFHESQQRETSNFADIVRNVINRCIATNGEPIRVNVVSELENCEKRRLYDLFNVLCSVGLCYKTLDKTYIWRGKENMLQTITSEYEKCEIMAQNQNIWCIFQMPDSPPIGKLAITMLVIYLFFGEKEMSLKQICLIMAQKRSKMSRLLRRLYLAAFFLEQLNLISHSYQIGSYNFDLNINEITKNVFDNMKLKNAFPMTSIASQLKYIDGNYIEEIKSLRKSILLAKMKQCHISAPAPVAIPENQAKEAQSPIEIEQVDIVPKDIPRGNGRCGVPLLNINQPILLESY